MFRHGGWTSSSDRAQRLLVELRLHYSVTRACVLSQLHRTKRSATGGIEKQPRLRTCPRLGFHPFRVRLNLGIIRRNSLGLLDSPM